jgi:hypothetical protein
MTHQPRKLLARLEPQSLSLMDSKPRRHDVGTARDARQHSPPDTKHDKEWARIAKGIELLREGIRGQPGPSRIHPKAQTRSLGNPEAMVTTDISGALAFAAKHPDTPGPSAESARNQLAVAVYLYRNWPAFEFQHHKGMLDLLRARFARALRRDHTKTWAAKFLKMPRDKQLEVQQRMALVALDEFMRPDHCFACGGYGQELTGVRVGQSCAQCGGRGLVSWSANARAKNLHVRRQDWEPVWSHAYLALIDYLKELERTGAELHAQAMGDED